MSAIDSELALLLEDSGRKPKLLVVDDQPTNIQVLHRAFSADYQVFMATNGPQALSVCRDQHPDLVLLDVVMDGMDGHEIYRQIKADPAISDTPVIFVTAHNDPLQETQGLELGAVDFISKPINPDVVRARVKTHIKLKLQSDLLRKLVFVDGLTGVFNRRYFDHRLSTEWLRASRSKSSLALILIDVDHFKRYNDRYGHQAGDDCLKKVAQALLRGLHRPADVVVRYGGEEFACLLPETELAGAMQVAHHLEQSVRDLGVVHEDSAVADRVTISLGVAVKTANSPATFEELLTTADEQLYKAKNAGRAQVSGTEW
ncbi:diguanylate cyclase [Aquabacterium sp.]|uniref:diguanylate cyclase n=1 Tax=Aquabacterium sp. TaxID=1872578 RepID=UPI00248A8392|nr:diguanylate cyclase [Aquabacterium sp.]MDI1257805.1 diguanylate cyclase [Aquabacterium sp.]